MALISAFSNRILFEDNHLLIINKLAGELSQGDRTGDMPIIDKAKEYIRVKYNKPGAAYCGLVHRLDRPTSGVLALAKTSKALQRMNKLFSDRKVEKKYLALTDQTPSIAAQRITHYLKKDVKNNTVKCIENPRNGYKAATLSYQLIAKVKNKSLLEITLETGRPHQIRVQLAHIGLPIIGDVKYGYASPNMDASICLHCYHLGFVHPVKKEPISFQASLPKLAIWRDFDSVMSI